MEDNKTHSHVISLPSPAKQTRNCFLSPWWHQHLVCLFPWPRAGLMPLLLLCCRAESLNGRTTLSNWLVAGLLLNDSPPLQISVLESQMEIGKNTALQSAIEVLHAVVRKVGLSAKLFCTGKVPAKLPRTEPHCTELNPVKFSGFVGGGGHHIPPDSLPHTDQPLCLPRLESVFPQSCEKFCNQIPRAFKVRFPGDSQSLCWILRLGSLRWGSEPSQKWENFFGIIVLQSVGHPPGGYRIWFYRDCTPPNILLPLLLCLWTCGIFFWWVPASFCQWLLNS